MTRAVQLTSFFAGVAAALVVLAGWRMPSGHANAATSLTLSVNRSPAFDVSRTGTVFDIAHLPPGRRLTTTLVVHDNLRIGLRLRPHASVNGDPGVTDAVEAVIAAGGKKLFRGSLSQLEGAAAQRFRVGPGGSVPVRFTAVLDPARAREAAGRAADVSIGFEEEP